MDNETKEILYQKQIDPIITAWNRMMPPCRLLDLVTPYDIQQMYKIASATELSARPKEKHKMLNEIMERRDFYRKYAGTNRIVYLHKNNPNVLCKVAFDQVALSDNKREMINQQYLKPFCPKVFEVDPTGVIGLFEVVKPIRNREEFMSVADRIFDIIVNVFVGRYVLDDFGSKYFLNWGVRVGSCPVLLDFPYLYKLDGSKLYCNKPDHTSPTGYCGGEIDYDDGFNHLICTRCGKTFFATELKSESKENNSILIKKDEDVYMKIELKRGTTIIGTHGSDDSTDTYKKPRKKETRREYATRKNLQHLKIVCKRSSGTEQPEKVTSNNNVALPTPDDVTLMDDRLKMSVSLTKGEPREKRVRETGRRYFDHSDAIRENSKTNDETPPAEENIQPTPKEDIKTSEKLDTEVLDRDGLVIVDSADAHKIPRKTESLEDKSDGVTTISDIYKKVLTQPTPEVDEPDDSSIYDEF